MKTGDRVKCVKSHSSGQGVVQGRDYIVYAQETCACGRRVIDVGIKFPTSVTGIINYMICRCGHLTSTHVFWQDESLFRKVEEKVNYVKLEIEVEEPCLN